MVDPAPIIPAVDRLERKGGREVMAHCPTAEDAEVEAGGGQQVVSLRA